MPIIRALAHGESLQRRPGYCRLGVKTRGTRLRLSVCLFGTARWLTGGFAFVTLFRPFLEYLAMSNLSPRTIQKHVDNMWVLGGEFITELNYTPSLRKAPVEKVLADLIQDGGPILHHGDSEEQQ